MTFYVIFKMVCQEIVKSR